MKIQGNLATYEFSDLLQWLAQGNKTGVLTVSDGGVEYKLGFDHGRIDMSSSSDPDHRLDSYLHRRGIIDRATLARAERLRDATKMMSGQVLVTLGAVSEEQLAQALREKTEEILCELLTWDQGTFEFEGGDRPDSAMVPINLEVTKLLLESMHRLDQQQQGGVAAPQPTAAFMVEEPANDELDAEATQAIDGLALAEVLDPESPPRTAETVDRAAPVEEIADGELPPPYAVMAQDPGPVRRLLPYALVAVFSLAAGAFYLANMEPSAEAVDAAPAGEPILFAQTSGPQISRAAVTVEIPLVEPPAAAEPAATEPDVDEAEELRRRYEDELAGLRRELEEARRLARPPAAEPRSRVTRGPETDLPADSMMRAAVLREAPAPTAAEDPPPRPQPAVSPPSRPRPDPEPVEATPAVETPKAASPPAPTSAASEATETTAASAAPEAAETTAAAVDHTLEFRLSKPKLLSRTAPRYPSAAERLGRGGAVTLRVLVGVDGRVEQVERVGAKAGMGFDAAAERAALASTWEPGTRNGEPTAMWAEIRYEFKP